MKIAVLSDAHDQVQNLKLAFEKMKEYDVKMIIFLGDFSSTLGAVTLAKSGYSVLAILGNNNGDFFSTQIILDKHPNFQLIGKQFHSVEIEGKKIFLTHYPDFAKSIAKSGDYDAVFYGHDHKQNLEKVGDCLLLNPGEILGLYSGKISFAIYETEDNSAEIINLN